MITPPPMVPPMMPSAVPAPAVAAPGTSHADMVRILQAITGQRPQMAAAPGAPAGGAAPAGGFQSGMPQGGLLAILTGQAKPQGLIGGLMDMFRKPQGPVGMPMNIGPAFGQPSQPMGGAPAVSPLGPLY